MAVIEVDDGDGTEWREMDGRGLGWTGLDWIGLGGCELAEGGDSTRCGYDGCRYVLRSGRAWVWIRESAGHAETR
ncbi:hypothetical protein BGZ61DRAFT_110777 [Ilyonectria robusta]|uniref:uncharacterized protein n=1 Tax=Ilyonectria robusta TaxID=1079257 RepID=UPI001E8D15BE|nr:uncharacterized protein BGZ61DRAFT_110777 [Ilyonectria robusta]KAH8669824.1 hypothetical protein BGZ61DRAFT_110777 [Ilyonectria robusta]